MTNRVTELLGVKHPILLGAMGVICNPELVAGTLPAGEVAGLIRNIPSAADIVEEMVR